MKQVYLRRRMDFGSIDLLWLLMGIKSRVEKAQMSLETSLKPRKLLFTQGKKHWQQRGIHKNPKKPQSRKQFRKYMKNMLKKVEKEKHIQQKNDRILYGKIIFDLRDRFGDMYIDEITTATINDYLAESCCRR